jgi:putative acetyltransferase
LRIRSERRSDESAIRALTAAAFAPKKFRSHTEAAIIDALRRDGHLCLSLVAEVEGTIVGHAAFSPVTIGEARSGWFGLGPISVRPDWQRQGIGKALIAHGLELLKQLDAKGCALIGDPAYYSRSGFQSDGRVTYGALDRRYVQRIVFTGPAPVGELIYAPAFNIAGQSEG